MSWNTGVVLITKQLAGLDHIIFAGSHVVIPGGHVKWFVMGVTSDVT